MAVPMGHKEPIDMKLHISQLFFYSITLKFQAFLKYEDCAHTDIFMFTGKIKVY